MPFLFINFIFIIPRCGFIFRCLVQCCFSLKRQFSLNSARLYGVLDIRIIENKIAAKCENNARGVFRQSCEV